MRRTVTTWVQCSASAAIKLSVVTLVTTIATNAHAHGSMKATRAADEGNCDAGVMVLDVGDASSHCEEVTWLPAFGGVPGVSHYIRAMTVFDDRLGGGPALYVAGYFHRAGGMRVHGVAKWDGTAWTALGTGTNNWVNELAVFDDGTGDGPALYAAGDFTTAGDVAANRIAKCNGTSWSALGGGVNNTVFALQVFDDGSGRGPALYMGGGFSMAGDVAVNRMARWDGAEWSALGTGMSPVVYSLAVFDDGSGHGPALYAGGLFATAGGVPVGNIAKWDGHAWAALGSGVHGKVAAMTTYDDGQGGGPALYAGGEFESAGGVVARNIARWDGTAWSPLGAGITGPTIVALTVFDDGSGRGAALYAGGGFFSAGGQPAKSIAKWDGVSWTGLGSTVNGWVYALTVFDDGSGDGPALCAGGEFSTIGGTKVNFVAEWDGATWSVLGRGLNDPVLALTVFDDGTGNGSALYAGGAFTAVGGMQAGRVARWDGSSWSALGSGMSGPTYALTVYDDERGAGPALIAGGSFVTAGGLTVNRIAKWDGVSWSSLGTGMSSGVFALASFDDGLGEGTALYAGGTFSTAGGVAVNRIAKWNGATWRSLGTGVNNTVLEMKVFDDGLSGGPALYVGGAFSTADGITVNRIARWDGSQWSALGTGVSNTLRALEVFDDGSGGGPALYAGGDFLSAGGVTVNRVAKWDGASWSAVGTGMNGAVHALTVFDDGSGAGPALYAGGEFTTAGGVSARRLAKWDGSSWSAVGTGAIDTVEAMTAFDDGSHGGSALHVGGHFHMSPAGDSYLAKWGCAKFGPPCAPVDFNCDGVVDGTDLAVVLGAWGTCGAPPCAADLNEDGVIDGNDLAILLGAWG